MPISTTNYGLLKPLVNDATDQDLWGGYLNDDMDDIDGLLATAIKWITSNKTANFSITAPTSGSTNTGDSNKFFICDATSGDITVSLAATASVGSGFAVGFKKTDAIHNVIIDGNASETIDGATTYTISTQNTGVILVCDGSNWKILSDNTNVSALAPLNSPVFTGNPTAPTQGAADNSTKLSTTAYADRAATNAIRIYSGSATPLTNSVIQCGRIQQNANTVTAVSFPVAFTTLLSLTANVEGDTTTSSGGDIGAIKTNAVTVNGFNLVYCDDVNNIFTSWIAVGTI